MKAESTIRKEIARLRKFIDHHNSCEETNEAYVMECALRWALFKKCDWSPMSIAATTKKGNTK